MKKAALIIASQEFRDEEYFITKEVLEKNNITVKTVCDKTKAIGRFGGEAQADILINELKVDNFDAIVFIGGSGAVKLLDNELSYELARETLSQKKLLAAICIAPTILAKAGVLENRQATVWSNSMDKSAVKILLENGAVYQEKPIIKDNNIITGQDHKAAREFGEAIVFELTKEKK